LEQKAGMNCTKMNLILFLLSMLILPISCSKESAVKNVEMNFTTTTNGLEVFIKWEIIAPQIQMTGIYINWGDNNTDYLTANNVEASHYYVNPDVYDITLTAKNDEEEIISKKTSVTVDFIETSLENIKQSLFKSSDNEYLILTLNLHTYQESQQNEKFNLIVDLIGKMDVDFIAFQECAQKKTSDFATGNIRVDNMGLIIKNKIKEKYGIDYNLVWDWAHYGWDIWEEGIAILSKHPLVDTDHRYISSNISTSSITSRKAIYGSYQTKDVRINIFSVHTHWRTSLYSEEQNNQINSTKYMVNEKETDSTNITTFVCGDFNCNPTSDYPWSEGYNTMMKNNKYSDTFLEIYTDANNKPAQSIYNTVGGDYPGRIDYIFMKKNSRYNILESQIIFKSDVVGRVSDHFGVLTKVVCSQ